MSDRAAVLRLFVENCGDTKLTERTIDAALDRFAAEQRLEEAKWWEHLVGTACDEAKENNEECIYCERIATLEKAAKGEK